MQIITEIPRAAEMMRVQKYQLEGDDCVRQAQAIDDLRRRLEIQKELESQIRNTWKNSH